MVVRLQNNLNMDTMASAMRAAAELTVEAGRLRGQGIASIGQGIARGIEGRVRRKDDEAARAQSQSNFELSRSDRLAEQAADNARQERFHQDSMDVNNAAVLRREQEDAAKAVQEAQLGRDPEAMAEAQRRYAAATQGLQAVASRSPSAKAMLVPQTETAEPARPDHPTPMNDEYNDIVAHGGMDTPRGRDWIKRNREQGYPSSPTIGKPGRPDTSVERGSTPRGGDPSISVPATSPVGRGSSLPITALPGAGQDAPESAPTNYSASTKKAMEAKEAEAALRLAQDAYGHSTSKENRTRLELDIKRLASQAAGAHAAAEDLAKKDDERRKADEEKRREATKSEQIARTKADELIAWSTDPEGARKRMSQVDFSNPDTQSRIAVEHTRQATAHSKAAEAAKAKALAPEVKMQMAATIEAAGGKEIPGIEEWDDATLKAHYYPILREQASARMKASTADANAPHVAKREENADESLDMRKRKERMDAVENRLRDVDAEIADLMGDASKAKSGVKTGLSGYDYPGSSKDWTRFNELKAERDSLVAERKKYVASLTKPEAGGGSYPSWLKDDAEARAAWDAATASQKDEQIKKRGR